MALSAPALVSELNNVLFPTLGSPTMPSFILYDTCSKILYLTGFSPFYVILLHAFIVLENSPIQFNIVSYLPHLWNHKNQFSPHFPITHPMAVDMRIITMEKRKEFTETRVARCPEGIISFKRTSVRTSRKSSEKAPTKPPKVIT